MKWRKVAIVAIELNLFAALAGMAYTESGPWTCLAVLWAYAEIVFLRIGNLNLRKQTDRHLTSIHLRSLLRFRNTERRGNEN